MNFLRWFLCFFVSVSCSVVDPESTLQRALKEGLYRTASAPDMLEPRALGGTSFTTAWGPSPLRGADGIACRAGEAFISEAAVHRIQRLAPDGSLSAISVPAELKGPTHLAFDAQGSLWVTATSSAALWKRTPLGVWSMEAASLPNLSGLVADQNDIYFSQCDLEGSISWLSPSRSGPERIAQGLGCPGTPALIEGALLVPMTESGEVWRIEPATGQRKRLVTGLHFPVALRQLSSGEVGILESGTGRIMGLESQHQESFTRSIKQFRPGINDLAVCGQSTLITNAAWGSVARVRPWSAPPVDLVAGGLLLPEGATLWGNSLLIADGRSVKRLHEGQLSLVAAKRVTPGFSTASGIIIGGDNAAYISAPRQGRVFRFDLNNPSVQEFSSGMNWPTSLARLWSGEIAIAETGSGQILKITSDGLLSPVTYSLLSPLALTADRTRLLVAEPDGGRIVALREQEAISSVASELSKPVGLAQDRRGRTFIVERGRAALTVRRLDGHLVRMIDNLPLGNFPGPYPREVPVVASPEGTLWLVLAGDGRILRVEP